MFRLKTKLPTFQREGFTRLMTSYDKCNLFFPVKYLGPGLHDFCSHVISYLIHTSTLSSPVEGFGSGMVGTSTHHHHHRRRRRHHLQSSTESKHVSIIISFCHKVFKFLWPGFLTSGVGCALVPSSWCMIAGIQRQPFGKHCHASWSQATALPGYQDMVVHTEFKLWCLKTNWTVLIFFSSINEVIYKLHLYAQYICIFHVLYMELYQSPVGFISPSFCESCNWSYVTAFDDWGVQAQ